MERDSTQDIYRRLIEQGTPQEEIDEVYRKLRQAGYGEEAARQRLEASLRRLREQRESTRRRRNAIAGRSSPEGPRTAPAESRSSRMEDWFPEVPPPLRRRVNKWAHQQKLAITGFRERWLDFLSIFRPSTPDLVNHRLLRMLAPRKHYLSENPYGYSLATTLEALYTVSRTFLGRSGTRKENERVVSDALRRRDPFACEYLSRFAHYDDSLRQSLAYLELALANGTDIPVAALARVTRETYRLVLSTEQVSRQRVEYVLSLAKDVLLAYGPADGYGLSADDAAVIFTICLENLQRFRAELYPVLLKAIQTFYEPQDASPQKHARILSFLDMEESEILTVKGFYEQEQQRKERLLAEQQLLQIENVEREKETGFSSRFEGILAILDALFPDSGITAIDQGAYLIPYFDERVFVSSLPFDHGAESVDVVSRFDPLQPVLVIHRIVDNLLHAIDHVRLERILNREDVADRFADIKTEWTRIYETLFSPYLRALNEYARGRADPAYAQRFIQSAAARRLEAQINQLRNQTIRSYGHALPAAADPRAPRLWSLVERLTLTLDEIGSEIHQDIARRTDPVSQRVYAALGEEPVADFHEHATPGSPGFKPVIRQLRRYVEAKYHSSLTSIPRVAQLFLLDVLRGVVELYSFLVNDESSFLRSAAAAIPTAGEEEQAVWERERESRSGALTERLRIRLDEHLVSEYTDALTGLKTKNYYLQKLPPLYSRLAGTGKPVSVLLVDIDHFKWVNDELGHQKGDEVLRDAATTLLDSVRRGNDIAIRYGGEELMVITPVPLPNAVTLAERLRHMQDRHVGERDLYAPILAIGMEREEPCATFSIGVVQAAQGESLEACVERADRALYQSKATRNSVTIGHERPIGGKSFEPFSEYASRVRRSTGPGREEGRAPGRGSAS